MYESEPMAFGRVERIRKAEKRYHESCYEEHKLFVEGSWLYKPVRKVMEALTQLELRSDMRVLDLGCGVGRNSIPIAEVLKPYGGLVECVDLLESALVKLEHYAREYGVEAYIRSVLGDIGHVPIPADTYDLIVAVSSLEHVSSEDVLMGVIQRMTAGTRKGGIHAVLISTNIEETDLRTGGRLDPQFELNFTTDSMLNVLDDAYAGWELLGRSVKAQQFQITREAAPVLLKGDCIVFTAHKR